MDCVSKGTDKASKGLDKPTKGTGKASKGQDVISKGTDKAFKTQDVISKNAELVSKGRELISKGFWKLQKRTFELLKESVLANIFSFSCFFLLPDGSGQVLQILRLCSVEPNPSTALRRSPEKDYIPFSGGSPDLALVLL